MTGQCFRPLRPPGKRRQIPVQRSAIVADQFIDDLLCRLNGPGLADRLSRAPDCLPRLAIAVQGRESIFLFFTSSMSGVNPAAARLSRSQFEAIPVTAVVATWLTAATIGIVACPPQVTMLTLAAPRCASPLTTGMTGRAKR